MSHFKTGTLLRCLAPFALVSALTGCDLVSPVGITIPGIPGDTGSNPGASTPVTGDLAARQAAVQPIAAREAARQGLPTSLVMAVIGQESDFQSRDVSSAGAQGLMQLMPETVDDINARAPGIHIVDVFDPAQNVAGGCWYLAWSHEQVPMSDIATGDDWKFALAAYNGGVGRMQGAISQTKAGGTTRVSFDDVADLLPAETRNYVPAVVSRWQAFDAQLASR